MDEAGPHAQTACMNDRATRRRHAERSAAFATLLLAALGTSSARASECYAIKDLDLRNSCLATTQGKTSYCYSIKNLDQRNYCLAEVKAQRSHCYSIVDLDLRNACLARNR
jgi:hypothetical protein